MCGIFGLVSRKEKFEVKKAINYFSKLQHRGKDFIYILFKEKNEKEFKIISAKNFKDLENKLNDEKAHILLGMNYHSVFGKPKIFNNFVFNGEVFNLEIKEELELKKIKNDGEILKKAFEDNKLNLIEGIYAFAYFLNNKIYLVRDVIGVNPLFFNLTDNLFVFASENKVVNGQALNPRFNLTFNLNTWKISIKKREELIKKEKINKKDLIKKIEEELVKSILLQTKNLKKVGILFSGGVDSTFIAKILQDNNKKFTCLISGTENSKDVEIAQKVAEELGFSYKIAIFDVETLEQEIGNIVYYLETADLMKVSVAIPFYFAGRKNDSKVVLSGIGSEELFGGYERHKNNPKKECIYGLLNIWERDLYRDNVISFATGNELRVPFLTKRLVSLSLNLTNNMKIRKPTKEKLKKIRKFDENFNRECKKYVFRLIAEKYIGVYAWRPKKAAQYGSYSEKLIEKLAKKRNLYKKNYLKTLLPDYEKIQDVLKIY